jgi:hypothetical protein
VKAAAALLATIGYLAVGSAANAKDVAGRRIGPAGRDGGGPTAVELASALARYRSRPSPPQVRKVRCEGFLEEPTEWECTYEQRAPSGLWARWSTYVAVDGRGFLLIDEPARVQPGRRSR